MYVIIGSFKGEIFIVGHTSSRDRADKWVEAHPNGIQNEFDWVERRISHTLVIAGVI